MGWSATVAARAPSWAEAKKALNMYARLGIATSTYMQARDGPTFTNSTTIIRANSCLVRFTSNSSTYDRIPRSLATLPVAPAKSLPVALAVTIGAKR